ATIFIPSAFEARSLAHMRAATASAVCWALWASSMEGLLQVAGAAEARRTPIAGLAVGLLGVLEHGGDAAWADGIGPGERSHRIGHAEAHRGVDVGCARAGPGHD